MVVGIIFVGIGLIVVIPTFGALGVFWTLVAAAIAVFFAVNTFSRSGLAHTEIEVENNSRFGDDALPFDERLRRLEKLRSDQLISDEEYQRKRQEIMRQSW
jgi:cytochrome c-type biogenesis protein CcmH/NrfG